MATKMKSKHAAVYENILDEFNVGHCGIKVNVTIALAKFNNLIFQISSRWLFIADSAKSFSKRHQLHISYTVRYVEEGKAQFVNNLPCLQFIVVWDQAS